MNGKLLCALLIGEADSRESAEYLAGKYQKCPYIHFIALKENQLYAIYFLPAKQKWWIETIEKRPKDTIGLEKVKVSFLDDVYYPKKRYMRLPKKKLEISPCKSRCDKCPYYGECTGCPATIFYEKV